MSHPFGELVAQHLSRTRGQSPDDLAAGTGLDRAMIGAMCRGRRLSDPRSRERVLAIIGWFRAQAALETRAEADALLAAAQLSRLDPHDAVESELAAALSEPAPSSAGAEQEALPGHAGREPRRSRISPSLALVLNALGMLVIVVLLLLRQRGARVTVWEETFNPLRAEQWQAASASAAWEDLPGPGAALRENHPRQDRGQIESAPIALDASDYPVLLVSVQAVEPGASYTIQVVDQESGAAVDVVQEADTPREHAIDLALAMGWQGPQTCTIVVWVGGESRAVTFGRIAIAVDRRAAR